MLTIVESETRFESDGSGGRVVIESDHAGPPYTEAFHELESTDAANLAIRTAHESGVIGPALNGNRVGPYPVNREGLSLDQIKDKNGVPLPMTDPRMTPCRYRVEYPISRSFR